MSSACCGHPVRKVTARVVVKSKLPPNPRVTNGIALLYLGFEDTRMRGEATGLTYYVSSERRDVVAAKEDAAFLLQRDDLLLAPVKLPK